MLSTIFKEKIVDTPQAFGSFVDCEGVKYCAISALLKYLGYDIPITTATLSNKIQEDNRNNNTEIGLIPSNILERVEDFAMIISESILLGVFAQSQIIIFLVSALCLYI
jgi:hypothetical protein